MGGTKVHSGTPEENILNEFEMVKKMWYYEYQTTNIRVM